MNRIEKIITFISAVLFVSNVSANSLVIKDNRLTELGIAPTLGRGYSVSTNKYQSMCYDKIVHTKPSFDFKYDFYEIKKSYLEKISKSKKLEDIYLNGFLNTHLKFDEEVSETEGLKKYEIINILVQMDVTSYYFSLDESKSEIGASAQEIIKNSNLSQFFQICGFYYIRSIGRHSKYLALLKYRSTKDEASDSRFKEKLKKQLFSLSDNSKIDDTLKTEFSERQLRINIQGFGLGDGALDSIVPTNISEFKSALKQAAKLVQGPSSGKITSMEIVPWIENIKFKHVSTSADHTIGYKYREMRNIEENSNVLAEIERIDSVQRSTYSKARHCLINMESNYPSGTGPYDFNPDKTFFYNVANPLNKKLNLSLRDAMKYINYDSVESISNANEEFMFGDERSVIGAVDCIDAINEKGIEHVNYRRIKSCKGVMKYRLKHYHILDFYCPLQLVEN